MSKSKKGKSKTWRISEAVRDGESLCVRFDDGKSVAIPLEKISPRKGKADWSQVAILHKGHHLAVPVAGGDYPEHEVPWDVLRWFIHPVW